MVNENIDLRALALETLLTVKKSRAKLGDVLNQELKKYGYLSKEKRAFYTRLTEGTLEQKMLLDHFIGIYSKTPVRKLKPVVRNILRLAFYQIIYMDSVPDSAAVNEAVKLTVKKGFGPLKGFVNGILRSAVREPERMRLPDREDILRYISVKYSMPEFIVKQWLEEYGAGTTEKICGSFLKDKKTSIRIRGCKGDVKECISLLESDGVNVEKAPYLNCAYYISGYDRLYELEAFRRGMFAVQDVSSMLAVSAAGIRPGDMVLDVCAAPGGKSMFAADECKDSGKVISRDISERKTELIEENARRCGITNIRTEVWDASVFSPEIRERMDVVLVDAPCSGYGIIGKKPDIKYNASPEKQEELAKIQKKILDKAAGYVRPGGRLIFSTCTISKMENEENVKTFLEDNAGFKPLDLTEALPEEVWKNSADTAKNGYIQLLPGVHDCDGFFIAGFIK